MHNRSNTIGVRHKVEAGSHFSTVEKFGRCHPSHYYQPWCKTKCKPRVSRSVIIVDALPMTQLDMMMIRAEYESGSRDQPCPVTDLKMASPLDPGENSLHVTSVSPRPRFRRMVSARPAVSSRRHSTGNRIGETTLKRVR